MAERKKLWTDHNDLKGERPSIHIELWIFEQDLLPPFDAKVRQIELEYHKS